VKHESLKYLGKIAIPLLEDKAANSTIFKKKFFKYKETSLPCPAMRVLVTNSQH